jgi:hypothetical protein
MKKLFALMTAVVFVLIVAGNTMARQPGPPSGKPPVPPPGKPFQVSYEDGTYRGMYADGGGMQVALEFELESNIVKKIGFRHLFYRNIDYRTTNTYTPHPTVQGIEDQYKDLLRHLLHQDIRDALQDLYQPKDIVQENAVVQWTEGSPIGASGDSFTGATVRAGKVISAIRDGLNRGVYRLPTP